MPTIFGASRLFSPLAAALILAGLCACAAVPEDPEERAEFEAQNDPMEPMNREIFEANMYLDEHVMVPVTKAYREATPEEVQNGVHNALANLGQPYVAGNDLLQGRFHDAADSLGRFLINSTFGLFGLVDAVADSGGPKSHDNDVATTLGVWGMGEGPYLMLPFIGPASTRDAIGRVADNWSSPAGAVFATQGLGWVNDVRFGTDIVDSRTRLLDPLDELKRNSIDLYAAVRSTYRQRRNALVSDAKGGDADAANPLRAVQVNDTPAVGQDAPKPKAADDGPGISCPPASATADPGLGSKSGMAFHCGNGGLGR